MLTKNSVVQKLCWLRIRLSLNCVVYKFCCLEIMLAKNYVVFKLCCLPILLHSNFVVFKLCLNIINFGGRLLSLPSEIFQILRARDKVRCIQKIIIFKHNLKTKNLEFSDFLANIISSQHNLQRRSNLKNGQNSKFPKCPGILIIPQIPRNLGNFPNSQWFWEFSKTVVQSTFRIKDGIMICKPYTNTPN